jgi:hypothetical protein
MRLGDAANDAPALLLSPAKEHSTASPASRLAVSSDRYATPRPRLSRRCAGRRARRQHRCTQRRGDRPRRHRRARATPWTTGSRRTSTRVEPGRAFSTLRAANRADSPAVVAGHLSDEPGGGSLLRRQRAGRGPPSDLRQITHEEIAMRGRDETRSAEITASIHWGPRRFNGTTAAVSEQQPRTSP